MPADTLRLRNMRFFAHHGLIPEENKLGQRFDVDLEIHGDFSRAGRDDDLDQTLDYPRLYTLVEEVVTQRRFKLVEALAEHIAMRIGQAFAPIELTVRVRKPTPPVAAHFDGIEVEIHRAYG
jgi:7,8-dihydroneopterin aldolase/epimerase/oxygenase